MGHEKIIQWVYYYDKNRTKKENSIHTKTRTLKMFSHWIRDLGILHTTVVNIGSWTVL